MEGAALYLLIKVLILQKKLIYRWQSYPMEFPDVQMLVSSHIRNLVKSLLPGMMIWLQVASL